MPTIANLHKLPPVSDPDDPDLVRVHGRERDPAPFIDSATDIDSDVTDAQGEFEGRQTPTYKSFSEPFPLEPEEVQHNLGFARSHIIRGMHDLRQLGSAN